MSAPQIGSLAPTFELPATGGRAVSLAALRGRWVALYFYPRDATPGCTGEAQAFRDTYADFARAGAQILGVSRDSVASHERFAAAQRLPFPLLADTQGTVCTAYDVIRPKTLYGRTSLGIERSTFLIAPDGVLRAQWRRVRVPGHAQDVLAQLVALAGPGPAPA
jgi:thioredoxin-dependent peroxiredoxin